jgi:hypothetical protein
MYMSRFSSSNKSRSHNIVGEKFADEKYKYRNCSKPTTQCVNTKLRKTILFNKNVGQARSSLYANTQLRAHRRAEEKKLKSKKIKNK